MSEWFVFVCAFAPSVPQSLATWDTGPGSALSGAVRRMLMGASCGLPKSTAALANCQPPTAICRTRAMSCSAHAREEAEL